MTPHVDLLPAGDRAFALLAASLRARTDSVSAAHLASEVQRPHDWDRILRLAHRHGLAPLLHSVCHRVCPDDLPPAVTSELRQHAGRNGALSALRWGTLLQVLARLQNDGIQAIAYKGPAAALTLYGHISLRQCSDLDIMVRPSDVWRAATALERDGYVPDVRVPEPARASFLRDEYVLMFRRDDGRTLLELHWGVAVRAFGTPLDETSLWARVRRCSFQGVAVLVPSPEDQLVLTCIHASRHGWDKLEAVAGVDALARRPDVDWTYAWTLAGRMRARRMLTCGLQLAGGVLATPVTVDGLPARRGTLDAIVGTMTADAAPSPGWRRLLLQLRLKDTNGARLLQCARHVVTPRGEDRAEGPLPHALSFAYPLVRAARLVRKYGFTK